jgi:asparagine synthase (glutamine-hydrolysing)
VNTQSLCQVVEDALGPSASFVDQMAQADLALWVGEHFNPRLDRISMTHSVEARVPFQDDEVVETALSIPMQRKSSRASRKGLLKRAFENVIPDLARTRPKRSYQAPGASWLQAGLNNIYRELAEGEIDRTMLFHSEQVRQHMNTWGKGTPGKVFAVSALVIADLWARHYLAPNSE